MQSRCKMTDYFSRRFFLTNNIQSDVSAIYFLLLLHFYSVYNKSRLRYKTRREYRFDFIEGNYFSQLINSVCIWKYTIFLSI